VCDRSAWPWRALRASDICGQRTNQPWKARTTLGAESDGRGNLVDFFNKKTPYEFWLTCVILLFGLIVIGLLTFGMKGIQGRRPEDLSRSLIVVMVITSALVLITAGFSNDQIAPAFGLFGTIVGYMLGRLSSPQAAAGTDHAEHQDSGSKPAGS
jgi:hypothetical protein